MQVESLFRALADPTRLRIVRLLGAMELAVGELAQVLGQSQPRVSRHVGILCDAGFAERRREGSWVFLRAATGSENSSNVSKGITRLLAEAEQEDPEFGAQCEEDRRKLNAIRSARQDTAEDYFTRHASEWDELRSLHSPDQLVEAKLAELLGDGSLGRVLDIGTGTGRMAELFAQSAEHVVALDKSLEMLRVARAKLQHLPTQQVELVQGDFTDLPFSSASFDTILLHQVLHFAQEPQQALAEAARVARAGARIAIVDFAAHAHEELREKHAHARLGFSDAQVEELLSQSGFEMTAVQALDGGELTVKIWIGRRTAVSNAKPDKEKAA
ncbi:ArsR/SmtB family transcription factor [Erythrobacter sp. HA6-11]